LIQHFLDAPGTYIQSFLNCRGIGDGQPRLSGRLFKGISENAPLPAGRITGLEPRRQRVKRL
jgi:hypothetical protein